MPYIGSALRRVLLLYIKRENGRFRRGVRVWPKEHGWKPCKQGIVSRVRIPSSPYGRLAQLGEHLPYKQGVTGSIPVASIDESQNRHVGIKRCRLSSVGRAPLL